MKDAVLESKKAVVSEIQEKMTASQSTVVVEYRGLTAQSSNISMRPMRVPWSRSTEENPSIKKRLCSVCRITVFS